jgi:hypothetical protein
LSEGPPAGCIFLRFEIDAARGGYLRKKEPIEGVNYYIAIDGEAP